MSSDWIESTVGEYCPFVYGKAIKRSDQYTEGIPVYGSNGVYTYSETPLVEGHAVIIGRKGSVGKVHLSTQACWVSDTAFFVTTESIEESYFIYYLLSSLGLEDMNTDAAVPGLNRNNAHRLKITIPKTVEKRIELVKPLIKIDQKIQLNKQANQILENIIKALYKSWFVDFEPTTAKLEKLASGGSEEDALLSAMQNISGKTLEELELLKANKPKQFSRLYDIAKLFPSEIEESSVGNIPKGWTTSEIGKEVIVVGGGTPSTKNSTFWDEGDINWTTPKDLSNLDDKILIETQRKITKTGLDRISSGLLPVNTVLMSSRAPVGYLALAKIPVAVNQGYIAMKCEDILTPEYVIQWCDAHMEVIKGRAGGTTFAEISKRNFSAIPIVVPSKAIILEYTSMAKKIYEMIENNIYESKTLSDLRDTLLPKLLSGELIKPEKVCSKQV